MQFGTQHARGGIGLDMTPIIDCVFNLLIFFALSFNFGVNPGISVKLPQASAEAVKKEVKEIAVEITKDGRLLVGGEGVSMGTLTRRFLELCQENPQAVVIIKADEKAYHGRVVMVMDAARTAGLHRLAIATRPKDR